MTIKEELSELTNCFSDNKTAIRCKTQNELNEAVKIFKEHYNDVEILDRKVDEKLTWIISCSNPKKLSESVLNEDDDEIDDEVGVDDEVGDDEVDAGDDDGDDEDDDLSLDDIDDFDLNDYDDPNDDMDLADENFDSIDDISEVDKANQLTVLKKRAADVAIKWQDMFNQIADLARALGLVATHDDKLNIEIKKGDGTDSKYEQDVKDIEHELLSDDDAEEDIDDNFGPSEYDDRAAELKDDEAPKYEESLQTESKNIVNENLLSSSDPNEIPIKADEIDDDF